MKMYSKWAEFPSLGKIVEKKPESSRFWGSHSESDTVFGQFSRHVQIAAQVEENSRDIISAVHADLQSAEGVVTDLEHLMHGLDGLRCLLEELSRDVAKVRGQACEAIEAKSRQRPTE